MPVFLAFFGCNAKTSVFGSCDVFTRRGTNTHIVTKTPTRANVVRFRRGVVRSGFRRFVFGFGSSGTDEIRTHGLLQEPVLFSILMQVAGFEPAKCLRTRSLKLLTFDQTLPHLLIVSVSIVRVTFQNRLLIGL